MLSNTWVPYWGSTLNVANNGYSVQRANETKIIFSFPFSHHNLFEIVSTQEDVFRIKHEFYRFSLIFYVNVWKRHTKDSKCAGRLKETKGSL
jgi:hypothetical protein